MDENTQGVGQDASPAVQPNVTGEGQTEHVESTDESNDATADAETETNAGDVSAVPVDVVSDDEAGTDSEDDGASEAGEESAEEESTEAKEEAE